MEIDYAMNLKKYYLVWLFRFSAVWDVLTCKKFVLESYKCSTSKIHTRTKFDYDEIKNTDTNKL
ncbi:protein of unknown function [Chryseobacterium sp. JV274]|nr:protein of unknown function [Chryseobacterium sp. JV274]